jgi:site-specific DNA recombinase
VAGKRVVGAIRLSSLTEETTSPDRQRALIQDDTDKKGDRIVGWAEDLDVSAAITPWDRPQLGQWLNDKADEFDQLKFAKLDRAVRSLNHFVDLDKWCSDRGIGLVILDPPLDLTDMWGRAMAQVLAVFAELERQMIAKRVKEGYDAMAKAGRWPGGRVPFGYKKVRRAGQDGWWLEVHQEQAEILRTVINRIIGGASTLSQARWLNEQGIQTARGGKSWSHSILYDMLRRPNLIGQFPTSGGGVLRGVDGLPIQRNPIISLNTWARLQEALKNNAHNRTGNRRDAAPILRVAFCGRCERPLYRRGVDRVMAKGNKVPYLYYRCASCNDATVPNCPDRPYRAGEIEKLVFDGFLERVSGVEVQQKVFVPGDDHSEELETARKAYDDLSGLVVTTRSDAARKRLTQQLGSLDEIIARLEETPNVPSSWAYEGTGKTYGELWVGLTDQERGALLREAGVQAFVARTKDGDGLPVMSLVLPEDLEKRAQEWAASQGVTEVT